MYPFWYRKYTKKNDFCSNSSSMPMAVSAQRNNKPQKQRCLMNTEFNSVFIRHLCFPFHRCLGTNIGTTTIDFGSKGPKMASRPWRHRFWRGDGQFSFKKITVGTMENNLNDYINIFFFVTFFEFLAASNAMVANESGVRRRDWRAKFRNF